MSAEPPNGPPRDSNGSFVKIPDSMPDRYRPDTPGSSIHVYLDQGDARDMARKLPHNTEVKTVKRDGTVEYHVREKRETTEAGVHIEAYVTCDCGVDDFSNGG